MVEQSGYLVKIDIAKKQLAEEETQRQAEAAARQGGGSSVSTESSGGSSQFDYPANNGYGSEPVNNGSAPTPPAPINKRFFMSANLDTTRINRDVQKYVEEVIQHLTSVDGVKIKVSLEVEAESTDGFSQQTVRTISENCRTMRVRDSGFED